MKVMTKPLISVLSAALLWASSNACLMAPEQCELKEAPPPCHQSADEPEGACCGMAHVSPAAIGGAFSLPSAGGLVCSLPDPALVLDVDRPVWLVGLTRAQPPPERLLPRDHSSRAPPVA